MARRKIPSEVKRLSQEKNSPRIHRAYLAEDYDGIGQYVLITLSQSSTAGSWKARVATADFGTGKRIPSGAPVSIFSFRGQIEILSMGFKP